MDPLDEARLRGAVFVVDDDPDTCEVLSILLEHGGFRSTTFTRSGMTPEEMISSGVVPDVILLDWNMPVMGGCGFLQHIRGDVRMSGIPLVLISGQVEWGDPIEGISAILSKPIRYQQLVDCISRVIRRADPIGWV